MGIALSDSLCAASVLGAIPRENGTCSMKKQIRLGLAAAAVVTLLSVPAVATAAQDGSTTNPFTTNGSVVNPFKGNEVINPHSITD